MPRVLIVDDEQSMREWLRILFQRDGFEVLTAEDGLAAREIVAREYLDLVLTDIRMPRLDGVELLRSIREIAPDVIVLMMTAHWTRDSDEWKHARDAGAAALFEKPFRDVNLVTMQVRQLLESRRLRHENAVLRSTTVEQGFAGIIGRSSSMLDVFRLVETVCRTNSTILITGESGTGKELVAQAMHKQSLRKDRPFVAVNCGAMPETLLESELFGHVRGAFTGADTTKKGLVEVAEGGTVFLDEIGEMTPAMQVKFLRVLQERRFRRVGGTDEIAANIRVIAATNRDLPRFVAEGKFREDLFYRLNVIPIQLPALRERAGDVPLIAEHFLARLTREMGKTLEGFAPEAMAALEAYQWPGNVRELENVVERAVALEQGRRVELSTMPDYIRAGRPATPLSMAVSAAIAPPAVDARMPGTAADVQMHGTAAHGRIHGGGPGMGTGAAQAAPDAVAAAAAGADLDQGFNLEQHLQNVERQHLERALRQARGVQTHAAELLGLSFRQFRYLAKKYGLKTSER